MVKLLLYGEAPIYVEYRLSETEKRIEDLLGEIGLRLEPRKFVNRGTDAGELPNNCGYDTDVGDNRYFGIAAWYGRWADINSEMPLEKALQVLADDSSVYQYIGFAMEDTGRHDVIFETFRLDPVEVSISRNHTKTEVIRQKLMEKYPQFHIITDSNHQGVEFTEFSVPLIDLCETVIGAIKPMKY